jgi:hypothetical protein
LPPTTTLSERENLINQIPYPAALILSGGVHNTWRKAPCTTLSRRLFRQNLSGREKSDHQIKPPFRILSERDYFSMNLCSIRQHRNNPAAKQFFSLAYNVQHMFCWGFKVTFLSHVNGPNLMQLP